jgi:hypothetical protein
MYIYTARVFGRIFGICKDNFMIFSPIKTQLHKMSRRLASNQGILFNHQSQLPKLPVPSLAETCSKFIETAKPLATEQELKQCVKAIEELQKPGSLGPVLQQRLQKRAELEPKGWFADWWLDYAYMGYRDSVVINVNYFFGIYCLTQLLKMTQLGESLLKERLQLYLVQCNSEIW